MPEETLRENKMGTMPENKLLLSMAVPMMTPATAMDDTISRSSRPAAAAAATTRTALRPPCLPS